MPLVDVYSSIDYVFELFSMLNVRHVYVVSLGELRGLITRRQLMTMATQ